MYKIRYDDWSGFIPVSYAPGLGGEFFCHLLFYRHYPFDLANYPFDKAGKFSFVKEVKPLLWTSDNSLFGWYMKSPYGNSIADHDLLVQKLGIGELFLESFKDDITNFNKLSFSIACYCKDFGVQQMSVYDDHLIDYIKNFDYSRTLEFEDYQLAVVHPMFRWFDDFPTYRGFYNAKAIQLVCDPSKGWLFFLLSFSKMYDYYVEYAKQNITPRKHFFDKLEESFIERVDVRYSTTITKSFVKPYYRPVPYNMNVDSFDLYWNKKDISSELSEYLNDDITIDKRLLDYYYNINSQILNHFKLDPSMNYIPGKELFDIFMKYGPCYFEKKDVSN